MWKTSRLSFWTILLTLLFILFASAIFIIGIGPVRIPPETVIEVLARRMNLIKGETVTVLADQIVWELRTPRILTAITVGALLALCGAILQSLTGNELADPYLLGISSGASVGAVFILVSGIFFGFTQSFMMMLAAFIGAILALIAVLVMATGRSGQLPPGRTILSGVAVGQVCGAAVSLMIMVFGDHHTANQALSWMLGSLAGVRWLGAIVIAVVSIVTLILGVVFAHILDAFAFGDVAASSLGIAVNRTRWSFMVGTALVTALTVSYVGPIGFVGLTIPHIVRLIVGPKHLRLIPIAAVAGALLLLWADTIARTIGSGEIPIGVVTAGIGAPLLIYLLRVQARRS